MNLSMIVDNIIISRVEIQKKVKQKIMNMLSFMLFNNNKLDLYINN